MNAVSRMTITAIIVAIASFQAYPRLNEAKFANTPAKVNEITSNRIELANTQGSKGKLKRRAVDQKEFAQQLATGCDAAAAYLDFAVIDTNKIDEAYLIILSRLGTGESSKLNQIRLAAAEEYLLRRGQDLKYVLAAGSRAKGLGTLELYVGGKLYQTMFYERNAKGFCIPGREGW